MNCFFHDNKPAVVACAKCGVGLCRDCLNGAAYTVDGKPICLNCSKPIAQEELAEAQKARGWALTKFLFSSFFIAIALMALSSGAELMQVWIVAGVAGLPTAFKVSRRSPEQRIMDEIEDRYKKDIMDLLFGWMFRLLFKIALIILLAPICAAISCISNLIKFMGSKKKIQEAQTTLDYINQCLYGEEESSCEQLPYNNNTPVLSDEPIQPKTEPSQTAHIQSPTAPANTSSVQEPAPFSASTYQSPLPASKTNNAKTIGILVAVLAVIGLVAGYFLWYMPYAKDRDALRTYVVANNVFLRSSQMAGVEYNIIRKVPYGSELITYSKGKDWSEVKVEGLTGYVASPYLLVWADFSLLNGVWGSADAKEYIESSKCRLALLDYCKRNQLITGNGAWQLHTLQKDVKPNNVLFPRIKNGYDKFTEFAFILKNNSTQERRLALYSFEEETERPVFLYEEYAPSNGQIRNVRFADWKNEYQVTYTNTH